MVFVGHSWILLTYRAVKGEIAVHKIGSDVKIKLVKRLYRCIRLLTKQTILGHKVVRGGGVLIEREK